MLVRRKFIGLAAVGAMVAAFAWVPASAQQIRDVEGLTVNLGIVPASVALGAAGHSDMHPAHPPSGSQHLLITLDDKKSGKRIGAADVTIEVTNPDGRVEKKPLLHTQAGGLPDYSELFVFGSSGKYSIRVIIKLRPAVKPIETTFVVNHVI
jgi:hypothetical protein